ncbi:MULTISPECIES: hypothetical protein [unclassified Streptomyces]|uniref:hypothetical protein n=1 Tax=unclassified Streptomyces TaxID=2593676 RepID=UPI00278C8A14|nr:MULTISPECIES: hypothetical protein [unclassified Streptomyces]
MRRYTLPALLVTLVVTVLGTVWGSHPGGAPAERAPALAAAQHPHLSAPGGAPDCDPESEHAPDGRQGVPTRGTTAHELLAPLAYEHGHSAATPLAGIVPPTPAGRGPPPNDPPSPLELSILRV